jgi:hypothetical protein
MIKTTSWGGQCKAGTAWQSFLVDKKKAAGGRLTSAAALARPFFQDN